MYWSPGSVSIGTRPSMKRSASSTKTPYLVVLMMRASKSSPTRSAMNFTFFHSTSSRCAPLRLRAFIGDGSEVGNPLAFEEAVHDQVGIAADGRREVGVRLGGEREVPHVLCAVPRLLERAQHEEAENALLGLAFDFRDQLLVHARRELQLRV